ncbi:MAG: energy transducer TonB, partial [Verrucomicrobia bacterium]|nr:energy transducer TonB [Cytophagales bacterium]
FNDIVFAGRNKQYGAYLIRKHYDRSMGLALLIGCAVYLLALTSPKIIQLFQKTEQIAEIPSLKTPHTMTTVNLPEEKVVLPKQAFIPPPKANVVRNLVPVVKPNQEVTIEELPPTNKQLADANSGEKTQKGEENAGIDIIVEEGQSGKGAIVNEPTEPTIFTFVEVMPKPEGGLPAFAKYLGENLKYPRAAQNARQGGKVLVSFVINENGKISDVKVVQGIGFGCDEEAMRVIAIAPAWIPGRQGGKTVKVRYTVPINFTLQD